MRSKISELLEKINRLANSSKLTTIDIDLLKQHVRDLYEVVIVLTPEEALKPLVKETVKPEPVVAPVPLKEEELKPVVKEMVKDAPVIISAPVKEKEEKPIARKKASINESTSAQNTLNEKLKPSGKSELHQQLAVKPLKELININKQFVLVRELFGGDTDAFAKAVDTIDSAAHYEEAENYIHKELFVTHNWGATAQPTRLFIKLVKQKFGVE